jgi:peptidoglycan/xylan/chitin deacetylase (PgdA/CDA1 family)
VLGAGGFDEELPARDDLELGLRLQKLGLRFRYLPGAVAHQLYVKSFRHFLHGDGETFGRAEVQLCRKYPDYRSRSSLVGLAHTRWWKRRTHQILAWFPASPARLLDFPIWACERLGRFPAAERVGLRLLHSGRGMTALRGAVRETGSWKNLEREFAVRLPVLVYHHVGPRRPGDTSSLTVLPERFERQVSWLARHGYQGICPADWLRWLREGKGLPEKPVLLTFDDGYADLAEYALPVLHRHNFGSVVYIVTGLVGGTNTWMERKGEETLRLLTADQIRYWAARGIEFGAHGRTHADLTTLASERLAEEVAGSRQDLEAIVGSRVLSFAYPYGFRNPVVDDDVRKSYDLAFLADDVETLNYLDTDPWHLRRIMVQPNDYWMDLLCRVKWGPSPFQTLRRVLRPRARLRR